MQTLFYNMNLMGGRGATHKEGYVRFIFSLTLLIQLLRKNLLEGQRLID